MAQPYTPKQGQYLVFIHHYTRVNGQPPAEADIQRFFRVSAPSVHQMIVHLEAKGLVARLPRTPRSLRVLVPLAGLPELRSPDTSIPHRGATNRTGVDTAGTRRRPGKKASQGGPALQHLTDSEAATLLRALLANHPEMSAEAERLAASAVRDIAMEDIAQATEDAVRALGIDELNSRAGPHADGYVEPTEAAWDLIEEAVMPLIEDIQRRLDAGLPDAALATCAGVVLGLYRSRRDASGGCLEWAPDAPAEMAGEAVCILRKALRKMKVLEVGGKSCGGLPAALRDAAPEWLDMLGRCWRNPS